MSHRSLLLCWCLLTFTYKLLISNVQTFILELFHRCLLNFIMMNFFRPWLVNLVNKLVFCTNILSVFCMFFVVVENLEAINIRLLDV